MSMQRFAVEFDRRVVGVAVRVPGGFAFYSSDKEFDEVDGEIFAKAKSIASRLKKVARRKRRAAAAAGALGLTLPARNGRRGPLPAPAG